MPNFSMFHKAQSISFCLIFLSSRSMASRTIASSLTRSSSIPSSTDKACHCNCQCSQQHQQGQNICCQQCYGHHLHKICSNITDETCSDACSPVNTYLAYLTLQCSHFPTKFQTDLLTSLLKNLDLDPIHPSSCSPYVQTQQ